MAKAGGHLRAVKAMIEGAEVVPPIGDAAPAGLPKPKPHKPMAFAGDAGAPKSGGRSRKGRDEPELPMLPSECPVIPLGMRGQTYYFLDELGQLISLAADKVAQKGILSMFGRQASLLRALWPRFAKPYKDKLTGEMITDAVNGWQVDVVSELLMGAAAAEGVFDPVGRVRGRGAHRGEDGALILHCGDRILVGGSVDGSPAPRDPRWHDPGKHDGFVYPTGPTCQRPAVELAGTDEAQQLLALLGTWRFTRAIDPVLLIGFIGAALLGGALRWRPMVWITGDSATGKSTLQELLELLFAGDLLQSTDATEAGLRQLLGYDTLPVALDEFEAEEDNRKQLAIVKLARTASSGGKGVRGGQDHKGHEFTARSCFLFSSILLPPLLQQDRNRLAVLELKPLDKRAKAPILAAVQLRAWGRSFRRRLVDQWPRFGETLDRYQRALADVGHGGRGAAQFGTLLACADLLLYDYDPDWAGDEFGANHLDDYVRQLDARHLAEKAEDATDSERCARHISSSTLPPMSGETPCDIATWCLRALDAREADKARERLASIGLRVVQSVPAQPGPDGEAKWSTNSPKMPIDGIFTGERAELFLAVASEHVGLAPLFRQSHWAGKAGAASPWAQTLRRLEVKTGAGDDAPMVAAIANQKVRIGGQMRAATLVPLAAIADLARKGEEAE